MGKCRAIVIASRLPPTRWIRSGDLRRQHPVVDWAVAIAIGGPGSVRV